MLKRTAGRMSKAGRPQICPRSPRGSPRRSPRGSPRSLAGRTVPTGRVGSTRCSQLWHGAACPSGSWRRLLAHWLLVLACTGHPGVGRKGGRRERGRPCVHSQLKLCQHPAPRGIPPLRRSRQSCAGRWSSNALAPKSLLGGVAGCGLFFCLAIMLSRP